MLQLNIIFTADCLKICAWQLLGYLEAANPRCASQLPGRGEHVQQVPTALQVGTQANMISVPLMPCVPCLPRKAAGQGHKAFPQPSERGQARGQDGRAGGLAGSLSHGGLTALLRAERGKENNGKKTRL